MRKERSGLNTLEQCVRNEVDLIPLACEDATRYSVPEIVKVKVIKIQTPSKLVKMI